MLSNNASSDLKRMASMLNTTGNKDAISQFHKVGNNLTKVNFKIVSEKVNNNLFGLHQAHDKNGKALGWDSNKGTFDGDVAYIKDVNGELAYEEATITIFEGNIRERILKEVEEGNIPAELLEIIILFQMISTDAHENEHDLNSEDIESISSRSDDKCENDNCRDVEYDATRIGKQIFDSLIKRYYQNVNSSNKNNHK